MQVAMPVSCLNTSLKLDFQNNNQIAKSFSGERLKFFVDETTTFNVVLSYLHINLKICSVSESVNFGFSTTQVSIPVLRKHTKVSMAEPTHCNILILCQLTMHDYTKYLTIFGRIPIQQLYCKKLLFKVYVSSMTPTWLQWQGIIEVITFDSTNSLTIHNTKSGNKSFFILTYI